MTQVFIDGSAGTTGLRIYERLENRNDVELIVLPEEERKSPSARQKALKAADIAFLCLPDAAAIEAVALAEESGTAIIDTSTAHRVANGWTYGFPELSGQREKISGSKRVANPGCHASGFIALIAPLVQAKIVNPKAKLTCVSLTGYSGGGKKMIADYEPMPNELVAPRLYGLSQNHKHIPEMQKLCGLENSPIFMPIVSSYYAGMQVSVSLFAEDICGGADTVKSLYKEYYKNGLVSYVEDCDENGFISAEAFSGRDDMEISVWGNEERILLVSRFDNLGKGASGAAIQNMNIMLGVDETTGLNVGGNI